MERQPQTFELTWQGITMRVVYIRKRWGVMDHLDIRSTAPKHAPLPISLTGYRSHFMQPGTIDAYGGDVVIQVIAWLDEEDASEKWRAHAERSRQGDLF